MWRCSDDSPNRQIKVPTKFSHLQLRPPELLSTFLHFASYHSKSYTIVVVVVFFDTEPSPPCWYTAAKHSI